MAAQTSQVNLIGQNTAIGAGTNQFIVNFTAPVLTQGIWPFGWMTSPTSLSGTTPIGGDSDFITTQNIGSPFLPNAGPTVNFVALSAATAPPGTVFDLNTFAGATANTNVKLTAAASPYTLSATTTVNAVLLDGRGVIVNSSAAVNLTLGSAVAGLLVDSNADPSYGATSTAGNSMNVGTLTLGIAAAFITERAAVDTITSSIQGPPALITTGLGTLVLSPALASTYAAATTIEEGLVQVAITGAATAATAATAFGTNAGATTVNPGAELQINGTGLTIAEPLTLNGVGLLFSGPVGDNTGALDNIGGNNTLSGLITLGSATVFDVQTAGQTLTLNGVGTAGAQGITLDGLGTLVLNESTANADNAATVNAGTLALNDTAGVAVNGGVTIGDNVGTTAAPPAIAPGTGGASEATNTVTITTSTNHNLLPGELVTIAGVGIAGYNGTFTVLTTPTPTTFTYTDNAITNAAASGGGTATTNADVVQLLANNQILSTSGITLNSTGEFDIGSFTETIGALNPGLILNSGPVTSSVVTMTTGNLVLASSAATASNVQVITAGTTANNPVPGTFMGFGGNAAPPTITGGTLQLGSVAASAATTFTVADGPNLDDFDLASVVADFNGVANAGSLTKTQFNGQNNSRMTISGTRV